MPMHTIYHPGQTYPPIYRPDEARYATIDPFGLLPYHRRINVTKSRVLEWKNAADKLNVWFWPIVNGARVPPSELNATFKTHNLRGPGCLCASQDPNPAAFTESAVFCVSTGRLSGEYVAACANHSCGYFSMSFSWINLFESTKNSCTHSEVINYEEVGNVEKEMGTITPASTPGTNSEAPSSHRSRKRKRSESPDVSAENQAGERREEGEFLETPSIYGEISLNILIDINIFIVDHATPRHRRRRNNTSAFSLLMLLDTSEGPGLTEAEFRDLFVRCSQCGDYMTKRAFATYHRCQVAVATATTPRQEVEVIDLTGDN
ncbi:hypothetical protein H0H81_001055 [Sphagnurus paluster]|uniref:Uncharacterized protein n=1 Tax=Sphagnurus paluster TaxID=117069 RepID=A0A9P7GH99_9AGAR|nr:hypothetical protein H0H81_001055 [Sphagnurus paluster]